MSLLEATRKALRGLGIHTTVEAVTPGNKEANSAKDHCTSFAKAGLMQQLEKDVRLVTKSFCSPPYLQLGTRPQQ